MPVLSAEALIAFLSLAAMEIVLGIDNLLFLAILTERVPERQRKKARRIGLALALGLRLGLLAGISWIMGLTRPLFSVMDHAFSGRDIVLLGGGLFLMWKASQEIYHKMEGAESKSGGGRELSFASAIAQIMLLDVVFSLDSVITAVGMADQLWVMVAAMITAVGIMLLTAERVSAFIALHPSVKVLGLSFLLLIGVLLTAEGFGQHIEKGYVYFAMAFSFAVELINMRVRRKT